ncbi:hypothetical protein [Muriicola soli]|uniref:Uncharacterized protein n=1 Tax=Muriicola soli TaxID=2507538 RepID=A0A411E716_9FLAO|nr:hypothetical protein [Muriicola soli]QBA63438.1 hypothetical protein EQY75_02065 [Muriicola soli]
MRQNAVKILFSFILLGLFLGAKGLSYHALSHDDKGDTISCELCEFALLNETISYDLAVQTDFPAPFVHNLIQETSCSLSEVNIEDPFYQILFGRPPPFYLV